MEDSRGPGDRAGGNNAPPASRPLVLLADDHDEFRATVAFHLAMAGYPVVEATSVAALVVRARQVEPDVVVVSDELGNGDLAGLMAILTEAHGMSGVPVITVSSQPGTDRLVECLSLGARDHVRRNDGAEELVARVDAVLRSVEEIEALRRRNAQLEFLGTVDPLTGMASRRHLEDELDRLAAAATRHGLPLSVVLARIDDLPAGPQALRHQRREAVVREIAYLLAAVQRTEDISGTWDDRTFVVILPVTPLDGARAFAERLRAVIRAAPVRSGDELVPVTVSAACAEAGAGHVGVLSQLESAVVSAQASGGNRLQG